MYRQHPLSISALESAASPPSLEKAEGNEGRLAEAALTIIATSVGVVYSKRERHLFKPQQTSPGGSSECQRGPPCRRASLGSRSTADRSEQDEKNDRDRPVSWRELRFWAHVETATYRTRPRRVVLIPRCHVDVQLAALWGWKEAKEIGAR